MFGAHLPFSKSGKDEAEKPFWISYADMMTSLMVLFLVVMSVTLLAVTKKMDEKELQKKNRLEEIQLLLDKVQSAANEFPGMHVDMERHSIDFGPKANFEFQEYSVTEETASRLRRFVHRLLEIVRRPLGKRWLKRVIIEGYTDIKGSYLYNLNLSMNRSHKVLCELLDQPKNMADLLSVEEREQVRSLFFVGGYSFNSAKLTDEESRRIEFRLEFLEIDEEQKRSIAYEKESLGKCQLS